MNRVQHFDRVDVQWDASTLRTMVDGTIMVDGIGAHVGNMTYHDDKGRPFVEHVPAKTLFDARSLESAEGTTLTIRHGPGLVTPETYRDETHGTWVKAWDAGGGHLGVRVRLKTPDAIKFVGDAMARKESVELSPTYEADIEDTPGDTEHGHHDAVQMFRDYSALAILGPDEARGGPTTRLQLDGPECAPKGSRVQVRRAQLDSAASPRIPFVAKERDPMTKAIISSQGRRRAVSLDTLKSIRAQALPHADAANADQIETGKVTIEIEGEETSELVLPKSMIEMLLEGIGAGPSAPAEMPAEELEVEQVEGLDAGDEDEKLDAKIAAQVKRQLDARDTRDAKRTARSSSVNADAARILPSIYNYGVPWTQVALDAIAKADPEAETRAKGLAKKAANGDAVAEGRLREVLAGLASKTQDSTGGMTLVNKDNAGDEAPWNAAEMPGSETQ